jgi:proteasome lid subunit RPN8/RPN11
MKDLGWQAAAQDHARAEFPRESCGVVIAGGDYIPCRNLAATPAIQFDLDAHDYAAAEETGEIVAIVHSHPNESANPSAADRVACEASGLPWWIVGVPSGVWRHYEPCGYAAPLIGRPFFHGVLDCFTLIRDWCRIERGIEIPNFERRDDWWTRGENLYVDHFAEAGFYCVGHEAPRAPKWGDIILMQVRADVPNHGAIWLGNDVILQHLHGRLSGRDMYGGYWRKHTTHWLRYGSGGGAYE